MKMRVALLLLVLNFPFGYGGLALFTLIAGKTGDARWLLCGTLCYGLSWAMLFCGTALAGSNAAVFSRIAKGGWRAWRRMRAMALFAFMSFCICGCSGVQRPERPLAYMYPSLMPMSALKSFHGRATDASQVKLLLETAGLGDTLAAYGFVESDFSVLARGLSTRGYAEIDARHCRKCPLKWLYISFAENDIVMVMRMERDSRKNALGNKEGVLSMGRRGELVLRLPYKENSVKLID